MTKLVETYEFVNVLFPCLVCCFSNLLKRIYNFLNFNIIVNSMHDLINYLIISN